MKVQVHQKKMFSKWEGFGKPCKSRAPEFIPEFENTPDGTTDRTKNAKTLENQGLGLPIKSVLKCSQIERANGSPLKNPQN